MEGSQMADVDSGPSAHCEGCRHEALLYEGGDEFLGGALEFIMDAVAAEEPVLVVVDAGKIDALRG